MESDYGKTINRMNKLGSLREPFIFFVNFDKSSSAAIPLSEVDPDYINYSFEGFSNFPENSGFRGNILFEKYPVSYTDYLKAFKAVMENLQYGNSYLVNLTFSTRVQTPLTLRQIFQYSKSAYKMYYHDYFVVFSPEPFIRINNGRIYSYPMKGTIDASVPDAENKIIQSKKEAAEHATIVDLIRNDLSSVAEKVRVEEFRYIEKILTSSGSLLQVSSKIAGDLPRDYYSNIGTILFKLLPAGSVTGAPKEKTVEIIKSAETHNRGFYTGVMGLFTGSELISSVMIRFIENTEEGLVYKSGGGITIHSEPEAEYEEMIKKVYVPFI